MKRNYPLLGIAIGVGIALLELQLYKNHQVLSFYLKMGELLVIIGLCYSIFLRFVNIEIIANQIKRVQLALKKLLVFPGLSDELKFDMIDIIHFNKISLENVNFRHEESSPLLNDVSLEVNKGEMTAIMGENECGKFAIIQILSKNLTIESGKVIINNRYPLDNIRYETWRKIIGIAPQEPTIFNGTVLENIAFEDATKNPGKVLDFIIDYGFVDFMHSLPQTYSTIIGDQGIDLTDGQKQMISLARALYLKPRLLILEDATNGMNKSDEQFILKLLSKIKEDMAILFITHRLHALNRFCDKIYLLENGTISKHGIQEIPLRPNYLYINYRNEKSSYCYLRCCKFSNWYNT